MVSKICYIINKSLYLQKFPNLNLFDEKTHLFDFIAAHTYALKVTLASASTSKCEDRNRNI